MKKIIINQENSNQIELFDEDSNDIVSYSKNISELLESTKVCILQTTSQVLILKPSKINSISVVEIEDKKSNIIKPKIEISKEDVIKD